MWQGAVLIRRRDTLAEMLDEIERGDLAGVAVVAVSKARWDEEPARQQALLRERCERAGVALRVDDRLSRHFVELGDAPVDPPLSSERHT